MVTSRESWEKAMRAIVGRRRKHEDVVRMGVEYGLRELIVLVREAEGHRDNINLPLCHCMINGLECII
ncbi:hypothetical protein VSDG_08919 [Cytospora chrysosperma]|uniref:Uncharacterized protein n=1 Tax=Cytospora chrysosperma TaxID=252740 RepID=A0A423VDJ6_CYTCH|nr:hypothetical protein VSDG_08919 [Valsa sordida]